MRRITINKGSFEIGQRQINSGTLSIGRSKSNDVSLDDTTVSGAHAKIVTVMNTSYIQDLDSTNGTFVNGERIKQRVLKPNDVIGIGKHEILFLSNQQTQPADGEESSDRTQLLSMTTGMQSMMGQSRIVREEKRMPVTSARAVNYSESFSVEHHSGQQNNASQIRVIVDNTSQPRMKQTQPVEPAVEIAEIQAAKEKVQQPTAAIQEQVKESVPQKHKVTSIVRKVISDFDSVHYDNSYRKDMGRHMRTEQVSPSQMVRQIIMTEKEMGSISKLKTIYALVGLAVLVVINMFILSYF